MKKTYQEQKNEYLMLLPEEKRAIIKEGMEVAEKLVEDQIRSQVSPLTQVLQSISQVIDTKKEEKKERLLEFFLGHRNMLGDLKAGIERLINIVRL